MPVTLVNVTFPHVKRETEETLFLCCVKFSSGKIFNFWEKWKGKFPVASTFLLKSMVIKHIEQIGKSEFQMLTSTLSKAKSKTLSAFI